jgi:hypothetical protein
MSVLVCAAAGFFLLLALATMVVALEAGFEGLQRRFYS